MKKSTWLVCAIAALVTAGWLLIGSWGVWLLVAAALLAGVLAVELVRDWRK